MTRSEQYLAKLADRAFLNLWSYPNVFNDKKAYAEGDGKELCDLLVVCGDHVFIFSDKSVAWPPVEDVNLAWSRWYRHAVQRSVKQIRGAQRWLEKFPNRIFLDPKCSQRLPIELPPTKSRKVHGIVVALGAGEACKKYFKGGTGSLAIRPSQKGDAHEKSFPFHIGDVDPSGSFIHVFDDATLDIILGELDTAIDLASYLEKKAKLVRAPQFHGAAGEEDLLAYYMVHMNSDGEHDFSKPDGSAWNESDNFVIAQGQYARMRGDARYTAMKRANEVSYVWDRLIETFTRHMLAGTTIVPDGTKFELSNQELGVRHMALVPRHVRRMYGEGIIDALNLGTQNPRMVRGFFPGPKEKDRSTGFFFMTLKVPSFKLEGGYDDYRLARRKLLEVYAWTFLRKQSNLLRIVGIATEPPSKPPRGASEDMIYAEAPSEWTEDFVRSIEDARRKLRIAQEGNFREYELDGQEFPEVKIEPPAARVSAPRRGLNRQQRRALQFKRGRRPS